MSWLNFDDDGLHRVIRALYSLLNLEKNDILFTFYMDKVQYDTGRDRGGQGEVII